MPSAIGSLGYDFLLIAQVLDDVTGFVGRYAHGLGDFPHG